MVEEVTREMPEDYESLITVTVTTERQTRHVSGTVFADGRPRIVNIKGIRMDAEFGPSMIYITNLDKPGFIGKFSSTLGEAGINIATFHVGREAPGGNAVALIEIDGDLPEARARQGACAAAGAAGQAAAFLKIARKIKLVVAPVAAPRQPWTLACLPRELPLSEGGPGRWHPASSVRALAQGRDPDGECCGCRIPVGRRRQRQDRRLAVGAGRHRRPLPGRPQCRPYAGDRRLNLQAVAAAVRRRARRQAFGHRQRRGRRSAGADRRDRPAEEARHRGDARQSAHRRKRDPDPAAASGARGAARGRRCGDPHRHDQARHRPGL